MLQQFLPARPHVEQPHITQTHVKQPHVKRSANRLKNTTHVVLLSGLTWVLSGCFSLSLAPKHETPNVPIAERWMNASIKAQRNNQSLVAGELGWRDYFLDPKLQTLIAAALKNNYDLKKAALNVALAEQQYGISKANQLPTLSGNGSATRQRAGGVVSEQYRAGVGFSNFELDFFGRMKSLSTASLHKYLSTREAHDAAKISIIANVAKTYYQWRISQALQQLAKRTLNSREQSYRLVKLRFSEGLSSGTDLTAAQSTIATAKAAYQQQMRAAQQAQNALQVLVAQPLNTLKLPKQRGLSQQFPKKSLFVGIPSKVLLQRPDIRQAEYGLLSGNADIAAARAAMFPTISLTGNSGFASGELGKLFSGNSLTWSIAPSINVPIFDYGRRKANVKIAEINREILIADYQKAVQAAFRDVSNALIALKTLDKQYRAEQQGQRAVAETLRLVRLQVQEGLANGLNLLDAQRSDFSIRQGLLGTQLQQLQARVDLYSALGGGLLERKPAQAVNTTALQTPTKN